MRAILVAALVAFTSPSARAGGAPEPKYEGKPLAYWVTRFLKAETDQDHFAATHALKAFGPDAAPALPTFIEMLADHSWVYRARAIAIVHAIGPKAVAARPVIAKRIKETRADDVENYLSGVGAMVAISREPKDAVPDLIPLIGKGDLNHRALDAICNIGPAAKDAIPAIRQYVQAQLAAKQKDPKSTDLEVFSGLGKLGPDVVPLLVEMLEAQGGYGMENALWCLEELGPDAIKAAPALTKLLESPDPKTQYRAAALLWPLNESPAVVPVLSGLLSTEPRFTEPKVDSGLRAYGALKEPNPPFDAAQQLGEIGAKATAALPALREVVVLGSGAGVMSGVCSYLGDARYTPYRVLASLGQAAAEAITKIEQKPKK